MCAKAQVRTVNHPEQAYPIVVARHKGPTVLAFPAGHPLQPPSTTATVRLGRGLLKARVAQTPASDIQLRLGPDAPWPRGFVCTLWIRPLGKGRLHVGPVIAILGRTFRRVRFGPQEALFRRMIEEAEGMGALTYVLSPGGYRRGSRAVHGYRHGAKGWRAGLYPLPDVLYNRTQKTPATAATERSLEHLGVRIFNRRVGSKWRQYRVLVRDPQLAPHMPMTRLLRSSADLQRIVARFGGAYIKPSKGGFGRGVWRVERSDRGYDVRHTDGTGRTHRFGRLSLAQAYRAIRRRRRVYIVQQRLNLLRWHGGIADVRVLMQKDASGLWRLTGAGVRVGKGHTIVSNLAGGGAAASLREVLQESFRHDPPRAGEIERLVRAIAERVARRLERASGCLGELGIDVGVDRDGRVWFLEANSRTGRNLFHLLDKDEAGRLADRRPMEFAMYLAGFRPEPDDAGDRPR